MLPYIRFRSNTDEAAVIAMSPNHGMENRIAGLEHSYRYVFRP
jgi:hypothetical protein